MPSTLTDRSVIGLVINDDHATQQSPKLIGLFLALMFTRHLKLLSSARIELVLSKSLIYTHSRFSISPSHILGRIKQCQTTSVPLVKIGNTVKP